MTDPKKTTLLLILDGWGEAPAGYPADKNAIALADTPFWDDMMKTYPSVLIGTSGNAVGLPDGVMGNSEVGHLNLGAGRVVWQEITRIDKAIEKDGLASNAAFVQAIEKAKSDGTKLHLMGLVSDGGVHSIDRHYFALLRLAKKLGMPSDRVMFHCFLDGRDTPPRSGKGYVEKLETLMRDENLGRIAVVSGRYWAMDRDKRWDRTQLAYDALVTAKSDFRATSGVGAVEMGYARDENDEFIKPTVVESAPGQPVGSITSGDQVIFFNFRPDRTRQLSHALADEKFDGFPRNEALKIVLTTMTRYETNLDAVVAFAPQDVSMTLGEYVSNLGLTQLRIAETEKYAHVTYFFSGGREAGFEGEDRVLIPSPKVATYDLKPEMSLPEVSERLEQEIR
jgi:2,3-bisphosphoglycerate-independent phosphoglycerate mutase